MTVTDDITGEVVEDARRVRFGLDGVHYEMDLSPESMKAFTDEIGRYVAHARKVKPKRKAKSRGKSKAA